MEPSKSQGSCEKDVKLTLIKTEIKNKYVVEAYERLKENKSLKKLLFSCLCGMAKFTSYFINEDNVFKGVMDVMEIVQNFWDQEKKFHGNVTLPELDKFMNSYFQFWIEEEDRSKGRVKTAKSKIGNKKSKIKDAKWFINLDSNEDQIEMLERGPSPPVDSCKISSDSRKIHAKLASVPTKLQKMFAVSPGSENTHVKTLQNEQNKIDHDLPELKSTKIKNSYVLETFRFKNGDLTKIYDCLCEWEGIAPEKVHLENFAASVKNTVRKADTLRKTKDSLTYDSFLMEFFKFPLVKRLKESKKMEAKEREKTEEKNKKTLNEMQTEINIKGKKRKKKMNGTTAVKKQKTVSEVIENRKVRKAGIKKGHKINSEVTDTWDCMAKPKHSVMSKERNTLRKNERRIDVLELQLKMKLQHQMKLHQKLKRQNNLIVRQRKHIRLLKQRLIGACSSGICKGIQCSIISATPQTLLVRVMKP